MDTDSLWPRISTCALLIFTACSGTTSPAPKAQPDAGVSVASIPDGATSTDSGLMIHFEKRNEAGLSPKASDLVKVHYQGWTLAGEKFDSSHDRGEPAVFPLDKVIPGWTEALQLMRVGDKARIWIPGELAYGDEARDDGAPFGTLVFDVELLEIMTPPPQPTVPEDVAAVPESAERTASGLAYRVLKRGESAEQPSASDSVTVHYSGWTTDGQMFDSSVVRNSKATFPLNAVIPGWTEGLQLMHVGDAYRFWIPANLAYGENPGGGRPGGMLVFDVELFAIN